MGDQNSNNGYDPAHSAVNDGRGAAAAFKETREATYMARKHHRHTVPQARRLDTWPGSVLNPTRWTRVKQWMRLNLRLPQDVETNSRLDFLAARGAPGKEVQSVIRAIKLIEDTQRNE